MKMNIINNKSIITVAGGAFDCMPYFLITDGKMRKDLKVHVDNGAVNHACVMAFYPQDAKSETFYFSLN